MNKIPFLSINVTKGAYRDFIQAILNEADGRKSAYVCVANAHMVVEAHRNNSFASIVKSADWITPDGKPLSWALRVLHGVRQERVAGMDLLPDLLVEAVGRGTPVFFYGGSPSALDATRSFISRKFPALKVAGMYSPPFRALTDEEEDEVVQSINASGAGLVLVALGCPKQEKWMASMRGRIQAVMVGIGGALPVMVGLQKRAPRWMQDSGLEWLYRLGQEPRRLFGRYAVTNTLFLYLILKSRLSTRRRLPQASHHSG